MIPNSRHFGVIGLPSKCQIYPAQMYYKRKGFYIIHAQCYGNGSIKILNVNARYAAIWITQQSVVT